MVLAPCGHVHQPKPVGMRQHDPDGQEGHRKGPNHGGKIDPGKHAAPKSISKRDRRKLIETSTAPGRVSEDMPQPFAKAFPEKNRERMVAIEITQMG